MNMDILKQFLKLFLGKCITDCTKDVEYVITHNNFNEFDHNQLKSITVNEEKKVDCIGCIDQA